MLKYPNINVRLSGKNGNAFVLIAAVTLAMKKNGISKEERDKFTEEATSGGYDNLLQTCMKWVEVE